MIIENQSNIKVHFAACEVMNQFYAVEKLGINYSLYTAFPFLERTVLKTKKSPLMPCHLKGFDYEIPKYIASKCKHTIQDSGLFTLMFGSHKGQKDEKLMDAWYNGLVEFTLNNKNNATCVEVDCQKILGVEKAWEYRERFANDIPNRIINVFHKEDGQKGLDRLIEFSNYIAISVPELRFLGQKKSVINIANYIKNKKPSIDIHLLGCTELKILKQLSFCSSADSTSYIAGKRYGYIKGRHIDRIKKDDVIKLVGEENYNFINKWNRETSTNFLCLSIYYLNQEYIKNAGNQD
tara:strand:- start:48 stop:929 length:882 start_codon:yes stop_codon:yes gene_type:complete